ncbi:MAG: YifB family Mg chelatase-like AAA ATPase [Candidatus Omnitrophota bacterium]|nr:YifB family Mg chelatase-like AAA ATPase [Candidatus Omnitrophota bacterium]
MLARTESSTVIGINSLRVDVEIDIARGLPGFSIVGLPDTAVRESIKRVKSAIKNCGFDFPAKKITVNLAPADIRKEGPSFDLPIAMGILAATGQINPENLVDKVTCGELSLDGGLRPIKGALCRTIGLKGSRKKILLLPKENIKESSIIREVNVYPIDNLIEAVAFIEGEIQIKPAKTDLERLWKKDGQSRMDFGDVKGQYHIKRGLEIAAAGYHNVLLIGPPGAGKTMLAKRIPGILSKMTIEEAIEITKIQSVAGLMPPSKTLTTKRPFRAPHHTISDAALTGGGTHPRPGEISLAHNGVLFLDELPEFKRNVLEVLRQPLEEQTVTVSRVSGIVTYPAKFMLVAATNPCPCGYLTHPKKECHCTPHQIQKYLSRISGPLLDRIDIHLEVPSLTSEELTQKANGETSAEIRKRVISTRTIQQKRYQRGKAFWNAHLESKEIDKFCPVDDQAKQLLKMAIIELGLSARAYDKILKLGRTIADLTRSEIIQAEHISEAIGYRSLDRNLWTI